MNAFDHRLSQDEAATIVQAANSRGFLAGAASAVFHHFGIMRARIATLQADFPVQTLHTIAIKANPLVEVLREVVRAGAGLEAASIEEAELALAAGCPAERVMFDSPAKTRDEIDYALRLGVYLNVDNFDELDRIAAALATRDSTSPIGLRVNPMVGGGAIQQTSVSVAGSKFGVPLLSDRQRIIAAFTEHDWLNGLHVHAGSQGCRLTLLADAVERVAALRREIVATTGKSVPNVDIGGGLPTVYRTGDVAPTTAEYRNLLQQRSPDLFSSNVRLVTEFGRAIQANCGIAVSRVEYVKPEQRLAVIHLGADFLLRPVYRPDDWMHEFFVLDHRGVPKVGAPVPVTIAGPLCFAGDLLARDILLPPIEPGNWIVIRDVGAYTLSMWSRHCSRGMPAVYGYAPRHDEPLRLLRPAETPADIVRFWGLPAANADRNVDSTDAYCTSCCNDFAAADAQTS
jgi:diaminopimelate decarboxylase